ncbi:MAG: 3-phosphoshikimate 1-carboxyvinyltransferase [Proteobacteria bacterium]|nr:3-phosphoshikimate 1-carboxyvinyltransferase [Pseudomonadota bacterium]NIS72352.1 3-phosphoshikimate 1-carboxyvinyltransferase [Pseudomonadota bacterium]
MRPLSRLNVEITVPGSKSYTARALVIGALACRETLLKNHLRSADTAHMLQGLEALGAKFLETPQGLLIRGMGGKLFVPTEPISLGGAGTAVRFLTTAASLCGRRVVIDGSQRMRERPIQDLLDALRPLGIVARSLNRNGCPPVVIEGGQFEGGKTKLRGSKSSQFLSSILLASPYAREGVEVEVTESLVSQSYVDLTMAIMRDFGAQVTHENYRIFRVLPGSYLGREYMIEGDFSSASYFFAAAAVTGGRVRVRGINPCTKQGDRGLLDVLEAMGCRVSYGDSSVEVTGGSLRGVDVDMKTMPDSVQTLAVVAAFAEGTTHVSGIEHLQYKETDRLASLKQELEKLGIQATVGDNCLTVRGGRPHGAEIETYMDHRMAMAFAVAGLRVPEIVIRDSECVNKSFPAFWALLEELE